MTISAADLQHILEKVERSWEHLRGGRIFITGGTGFFGKWLLSSLIHADRELGLDLDVTVLTRDPHTFRRQAPSLARAPITLIQGDVETFEFPGGEFKFVIHAATSASSTLTATRLDRITESMNQGTRRVLDFAREAKTTRLLFTSSGAIYGQESPSTPKGAYAEGKRQSEKLCLAAYEQGMETVIARCFAFVGPYLDLNGPFAIGNFIRDAMRGGPIVIQGDGTPIRSYLYAADLAIWLWTLLLKGKPGRAYDVGSERAISIAETARKVAEQAELRFGERPEIQILSPPSGGTYERYVPDTSKTRKEFALEEWIPLEEGIRRTFSNL